MVQKLLQMLKFSDMNAGKRLLARSKDLVCTKRPCHKECSLFVKYDIPISNNLKVMANVTGSIMLVKGQGHKVNIIDVNRKSTS